MSSSLNSTRSVLWAAVADGSFQKSVGLVGDGNSTRNRHISWENPRFPEDFPWNQFIDDIDARQPTTRKANGFAHELFGNMLISTIRSPNLIFWSIIAPFPVKSLENSSQLQLQQATGWMISRSFGFRRTWKTLRRDWRKRLPGSGQPPPPGFEEFWGV